MCLKILAEHALSPSVLAPDNDGNTIEECCVTTGQCFGNDDSEDFDCESVNMEDNPDAGSCPETGCTKEICCNTVSGRCTGNTDSSKDIDCSNLYGSNGGFIRNHETFQCSTSTCLEEECCEITGYCSGNTVNRDLEIPYKEDTTESGEIRYSVNCEDYSTVPNRIASNKGDNVVGVNQETCCNITGYCYGNTNENEDFNIEKCIQTSIF